jgi:trans-2-enoyl-CoA reductase
LTKTLSDWLLQNISLQANLKLSEEIINEQAETINQFNEDGNSKVAELEQTVQGHLDTILNLNKQLEELSKMRSEYENVKHQVGHVDTFRNELAKERDEHQNTRNNYEAQIKASNEQYEVQVKALNDQIEYLQLTPAKRKKIDDAKAIQTVDVFQEDASTIIRDGGSF